MKVSESSDGDCNMELADSNEHGEPDPQALVHDTRFHVAPVLKGSSLKGRGGIRGDDSSKQVLGLFGQDRRFGQASNQWPHPS